MAKFPVIAVLPPLIFAGLAATFYIGMQKEDADALPSTLIGKPAAQLTTTPMPQSPSFDGEDLAASGVKLVNFWASWCVPCRAEHPQLEQLAEEGVTLYGVNYKDKPEDAERFLAELGNPFTALGADTTGVTARDWGVYGVPETFVVDGEGNVVLRFAGPIDPTVLESKIRPAMEEAAK
ncbi:MULTISPECIES: DsbE family thiol:disulfide interchange protein [Halocynthiibacter]|uniref:DsbE family thiol:disulfide interchange protein n=1 Tax=Halocynthiibacter halioticoli TaxID=2986804 RepID=A0AAE3LSV8_9RHOB|nr:MULTISPECIES: DsbE family thiol:disulfide interchange protein [Halocynthiibacter]MCV6824051.1 DsbE family thiol:disulfide interchange protein [Halocynthiibacter halioticoli]MCW4057052.1 DsbE family thiol:disulfide interchange protein [Halocynthiibacter sp. SDUM655004]MDE0589922.1 DsbE family thiol:disulfide interchange protein [Halocynthiibacter sp. C4]